MSTLLCVLGIGKGSWGHLLRLINDYKWDNVYVISNEWGKEKFTPAKEVNWIIINTNMGFDLMSDTIYNGLPNVKKISLNILSGDGKIHMATINALNKKLDNFKLAILTKDGLKEY